MSQIYHLITACILQFEDCRSKENAEFKASDK